MRSFLNEELYFPKWRMVRVIARIVRPSFFERRGKYPCGMWHYTHNYMKYVQSCFLTRRHKLWSLIFFQEGGFFNLSAYITRLMWYSYLTKGTMSETICVLFLRWDVYWNLTLRTYTGFWSYPISNSPIIWIWNCCNNMNIKFALHLS